MLLFCAVILSAMPCAAQPFSITVRPDELVQVDRNLECTISPIAASGFHASIFLRAHCATLPGLVFDFTPPSLRVPYDDVSRMSITVTGPHPSGRHEIVVEGYNGTMVVADTCILTIPDHPRWRVYTMDNSPLPSNKVTCLAFGIDGVGWIGTDGGLARFDGTDWQIYYGPTDFHRSISVTSITTDTEGEAWIVDRTGDLYRTSGSALVRVPLPDCGIRENAELITTGSDGSIWIASGYDGLSYGCKLVRYDHGAWTTFGSSDNPIPIDYISDCKTDAGGRLWLGDYMTSTSLLSTYDGTYWAQIAVADVDLEYTETKRLLFPTKDGAMWVTVQNRVFRFENGSHQVFSSAVDTVFPGRRPEILAFDSTGTRWVAGGGQGLWQFGIDGAHHHTVQNSGIPSGVINDMKVHDSGTLWIATPSGLALFGDSLPPGVGTTVLDHTDQVKEKLSISPNPASVHATATIDLSAAGRLRLQLYDMLGRADVVIHDAYVHAGHSTITMNVSSHVPGLYFLRASVDERTLDTRMFRIE